MKNKDKIKDLAIGMTKLVAKRYKNKLTLISK
jgi:hypothetical protein